MAIEVIDSAAAVPPEDAAGMRIVHHHDGAEFLGGRTEIGQRAEIAIHRKNSVRDHELALRGGQLLENPPRGVDVFVREYLYRGPAETRAVDDAGVIELIGDVRVFF